MFTELIPNATRKDCGDITKKILSRDCDVAIASFKFVQDALIHATKLYNLKKNMSYILLFIYIIYT